MSIFKLALINGFKIGDGLVDARKELGKRGFYVRERHGLDGWVDAVRQSFCAVGEGLYLEDEVFHVGVDGCREEVVGVDFVGFEVLVACFDEGAGVAEAVEDRAHGYVVEVEG